MVIVRSAFVNGGAIIPIRWSSDARRAQQQLSRTYSTQKPGRPSPSPKVRARAFRVYPKPAEKIMYEKALEATHSRKSSLLRWASEKIGGDYDNELNKRGYAGKSLERVHFKAYYWPVWKFSCFAETRGDNNETSIKAIIDMPDHVIPGSHVSPLSLLPFGNAPFEAQYVKPYDPKIHLTPNVHPDLRMPISTIPFSISPFDVMELARNSAPPRVRLMTQYRGGNEFWISAKHDIREVIVAAYPVYHPIYVAEYDFVLRDDLPTRRIAVAMDGYKAHGSSTHEVKVFIPNVHDDSWKSTNRGYWANRDDDRTDLNDLGADAFFQGFHEETLSIWLNPPARPRTPPTKGQDKRTITLAPPASPLESIKVHESSIPWDDVRIQEYGSSDFLANRAWVRLNAEKFGVDIAVNRYKGEAIEKAIKTKNKNVMKELDQDPFYAFLTGKADEMKERWQRGKPDWLKKPGSLGKRRIKPDPSGRFLQ
ncbi:hypothetical protein HD553DRAFT_302739 [Filobasidium floriforme]|uniref:uncharacterized protein n=1 Tax=Filobasidium floriforme TaxID=5210 RepID=UPI001E8D3635|nr:uncharacterized protein HD553DRAFT_302739 [Filobasidium floriforme]KAH8090558.1 hypothetical protein HD553DRAFT_302739 [Filobasidium floriforme]